MAEEQAAHRRTQEDRVIRANIRAQFMGSIFAFFLAAGAIGSGVYLIFLGRNVDGLIAIITALASLVAVFIAGKSGQQKERQAKRQHFQS